jgi:hypothetical protein
MDMLSSCLCSNWPNGEVGEGLSTHVTRSVWKGWYGKRKKTSLCKCKQGFDGWVGDCDRSARGAICGLALLDRTEVLSFDSSAKSSRLQGCGRLFNGQTAKSSQVTEKIGAEARA